eukprot:scaffold4240_cov120-Isochrysis_galbana.AAC.1
MESMAMPPRGARDLTRDESRERKTDTYAAMATMPKTIRLTTCEVAEVMSSLRIASDRTDRNRSGQSMEPAGSNVEPAPPGVPGAPTSRSRTSSSQASTSFFRSNEPSSR